jgi:hypothetical protein
VARNLAALSGGGSKSWRCEARRKSIFDAGNSTRPRIEFMSIYDEPAVVEKTCRRKPI